MFGRRRGTGVAALATGIAVVGALTFAAPQAAHADVIINVTTTADIVDGGDGLVSFREAIDQANAASQPVVINLANSEVYQLTYCDPVGPEPPLNRRGALELRTGQPVTIHGNSSTVTQLCAGRPHLTDDPDGFFLNPTNNRSIDHLIFADGKGSEAGSIRLVGDTTLDNVTVTATTISGSASKNAAVWLGPKFGIFASNSTLTDSRIQGTTGGTGLYATGLIVGSNLNLVRSQLVGNTNNPGGSAAELTGGLYSALHVTATDSAITGNTGTFAGGIAVPFQRVDLVRTTVTNNTGQLGGIQTAIAHLTDATVSGNTGTSASNDYTIGGILAPLTLAVERSTIAGNTGKYGGLVAGVGTIHNSTISGNTGTSVGGAEIAGNIFTAELPQVPDHSELVNTTIADNTGGVVGGLVISNDRLGQPQTAIPVHLATSTIAGNQSSGAATNPKLPAADELSYRTDDPPLSPAILTFGSTAIGDGDTAVPDCAVIGQSVVSQGYNVSADDSCGLGVGTGDLINAGDTQLGVLAAFGPSPLAVRLPDPGSVLRDHVPSGAVGCPGTDERGRARPQGPGCDVGAAEAAGGGYHPLPLPFRVTDTRDTHTPLGPGESRAFSLAAAAPGVGGWQSAVLNITATDQTASTHLTVYADGSPQPLASNLNPVPGQNVANNVVAPVDENRRIRIFNNAGTTDVIIDIVGYFDDGKVVDGADCPCGDSLTTLPAPERVLDTRDTNNPFGPGETRTLHLGGPAFTGADAVAMNITVTGATGKASHLTVWPSGIGAPLVSNINWNVGDTVANGAYVRLPATGDISIRNNDGTVQVIIDVVGVFRTESGGARYTTIGPVRALDTRTEPPAGGTPLQQGETRLLPLSPTFLPTGSYAVVANLTAVFPTEPTHLTAWPGDEALPDTSTLNAIPGQTRPNLFLSGIGDDGVNLYNNSGQTQTVVDIQGWFG